MRKFTALLIATLLVLSLAACGGNGDEQSSAPTSSESSTPADSNPTSDPVDDPASSDASSDTDAISTTVRSRTTTTETATTTTTTVNPYISTVGEKPVTYNTAILYNKQTSSFDAQAETMRQSILNEEDTVKPSTTGTTYYISPKGDDTNPGTSKDKPWRTTKNLSNHLAFKAGDVVLFERGGVYRNVSFHMASGVSYGAYGTGAKPCLYGSDKNYADESLWEETSTANVWRLNVGKNSKDVGNFVFDHGKASGIKMLKNITLTIDFQFYHDTAKGYVYLYLAAGNPGKVYSDIEMCVTKRLMYTKSDYKAENITIENLCIKYTGAHGIVVQAGTKAEAKNITVRGCEIGWIGGGLLDADTQYGNGIEFNGPIDGALVEDNWIYQCYDTGYTNQGSICYQKNITVQDNLIEYNPYNIEVWTEQEIGKGGLTNCSYINNLLRFAGYGFGTVRPNTSAIGNISFYDYVVPCENTVISGNIFDCSYRYVISIAYPNDAEGRGPTIIGNTWVQKPYSTSTTTASVGRSKLTGETVIYSCGTQAEMETNVKVFDKAPTAVYLEN